MTGSPTLAYNVYMLLSLFLNGVFTYRILRRTGSPPTLAVIGGAMMIWLPVSVRQLEVLQNKLAEQPDLFNEDLARSASEPLGNSKLALRYQRLIQLQQLRQLILQYFASNS